MTNELGARENKRPNIGSVYLSIGSGVIALAFIVSAAFYFCTLNPNCNLIVLGVVLGLWSLAYAFALIVWGCQNLHEALEHWKSDQEGKLFGHPTLEMVAGVSAAILTAVTFLLIFAQEAHKEAQPHGFFCPPAALLHEQIPAGSFIGGDGRHHPRGSFLGANGVYEEPESLARQEIQNQGNVTS